MTLLIFRSLVTPVNARSRAASLKNVMPSSRAACFSSEPGRRCPEAEKPPPTREVLRVA